MVFDGNLQIRIITREKKIKNIEYIIYVLLTCTNNPPL